MTAKDESVDAEESGFNAQEHPHRRLNPLTGEWVLVSPHRARRPWQGEVAWPAERSQAAHDPNCYLCPGNARANKQHNPDYEGPFVFPNDFPSLLPESAIPSSPLDGPFGITPARGEARVICFSEHHSRSLRELPHETMRKLVDCWCSQSEQLGQRWAHVQLFENKGSMMGCSNPHPHAQIWASDFVPSEVQREDGCQRDWLVTRGTVLLDDVARQEQGGERLVDVNSHWLCIVPWWASWPFETLLIARAYVTRLEQLSGEGREALAAILQRLTARYDNLFETSFPYSAGWHGAPHAQAETGHWRLHAHFYPPLLRSASIRKFMVGFEMLAEAQRDLTPEQAATRLRASSPETAR